MKRFLALAALVLGLASCQTEPEGLNVNVGGEQDTYVTVSLPETTRANSAEGAFVNLDLEGNDKLTVRYVFQVFYGEETGVQKQVIYSDEKSVSFPVRLVPGREYSFVAWADVAKKDDAGNWVSYYNTENLKNITFDVAAWKAMDETRDAFTDVKTVEYGNTPINLELKRPFAKLRVITTDMEALNDLKIAPTKATVEYTTPHYTTFDAVAGAVKEGTKTMTKAHTEFRIADYDDNVEDKSMVLFTDYFFATKDQEVIKFSLDVYDQGGNPIGETKNFGTSIPAQRNYLTTIQGNILTDGNNVTVTVEDAFDGYNTFVDAAALAQEALDNAAPNTTIYLEPGVDYGTLYLRPVAGAAPCKVVDWIGNNYRYETYSLFENLTIVGAEGATVDAIKIEGGTYYNTDHSQKETYPIMLSLIELKNVVFDGVTFTGKGGYDPQGYGNAVNLSGNNIKVDGLTFKNCVLNNNENNARLLYKTESTTHVHTYAYNGETYTFTPSLKNITITDCTLNGGYMGLELREAENITITNNEFNVNDRNILLPVNTGCTYSGKITITGNVSNNAKERFVRMAGAGDAVVVIKDNLIKGYKGTDEDFIKVTDGTNVTIKNNFVVSSNIDNYDDFIAEISDDTWYDDTATDLIIEDVADYAAFVKIASSGNDFEGKTIKLNCDIDLYFKDVTALADSDPATFRPIGDTKYNGGKPFKGTFDGQNHTIKNLYQNGWDLGYEWGVYGSYGLFGTLEDATVKNVVIEGSESYIEGGDVSFIAGSAKGDCVFENITINSGVAATYNNGCGGIIGWSGAGTYTFKNITIGEDVVLGGLWGSFDSSIGGVVGQAEPGATYNFENVTINCRIDAYNDCTASYDYYNYRMCGMIIGRCEETTTINGSNYPDLSKYDMTFTNVVVNYGDWMNYHYCRRSGERAVRVEAGYAYGGAENRDHSGDNAHCMEWIPFNQLIGGDQYAVKGLPAVEGVTVNYPESFYREQGYKAVGDTYTVYSGAGFKTIATTVLADGTKNVTIELANDIDLAGIEWPAVCTKAAFVLDGKGKTIKNLTTTAVEDHGFYSTAMFTSTRKATTIKNLVVENATVTGKGVDNSHGAVLVACNYAALNIEGVTVKNSTVSNCDRSSVLVTYLYFTTATVKNCVVEGCTVNSIGTAGALLGMNNSHDFEATGNTVKNTTISSSEGSNKAGILIGTWQSTGTLTESNNDVENSKAINAGTETNNNIGRTV